MKPETRREFLKKSAAATFGFTFIPAYLTSARAKGSPLLPPSQRINLGCIGVGGRATGVIPSLCNNGGAVPVAFCDVDYGNVKRKIAKNLKAFPDVKRYKDFRIMLEEMGNDIDAVSVVVPDHMHFPAAILAMSMGKHVYVEKPLTHTFEEAGMLMRAEKKYNVVTQMGNQGHTSSGALQFKQAVDDGIIKDITHMDAWKTPGLWFMQMDKRISAYPPAEPIPASLDNWDLWCGPNEVKPYSSLYHPFNWRAFYLYGGGMLGDWGCHIVDFAHDYLKLGLPTKITPLKMVDHNHVIFPESSQIKMHFPARGAGMPAMDRTWRDGQKCHP